MTTTVKGKFDALAIKIPNMTAADKEAIFGYINQFPGLDFDDNVPSFLFEPRDPSNVFPDFDDRRFAEYRYGNWTGASFGAGRFISETESFSVSDRMVPARDIFDAISRTHDLLYDERQQALLEEITPASTIRQRAEALLDYHNGLSAIDRDFVEIVERLDLPTDADDHLTYMQEAGARVMNWKSNGHSSAAEEIANNLAAYDQAEGTSGELIAASFLEASLDDGWHVFVPGFAENLYALLFGQSPAALQVSFWSEYLETLPPEALTPEMLRNIQLAVEWSGDGALWVEILEQADNLCFASGTDVAMADGTSRRIEDVAVGDCVLSFDPSVGSGRAALVPRTVTRLFRNTTEEWLELSFADRDLPPITVTPGHEFLSVTGDFVAIGKMVALGGGRARIVMSDGSVEAVTARRIAYSEATAPLYESTSAVASADGMTALAAKPEGWQTYNFEVEGLHTYVAGGARVHNRSLLSFAPVGLEPISFQRDGAGNFTVATYAGAIDGKPVVANVYAEGFDAAGNSVVEYVKVTTIGNNVSITTRIDVSYDPATGHSSESIEIVNIEANGSVRTAGVVATALGSELGAMLVGDNIFAQVGVNTLVGTVSQNIAEAVGVVIDNPGPLFAVDVHGFINGTRTAIAQNTTPLQVEVEVADAVSDFGIDLVQNFTKNALTTFSSILMAEAADALGLEGFAGGLFETATGAVTNHILNTLADNAFGTVIADFPLQEQLFDPTALGGALASAIGGFAGRYIGQKLVNAQTPEEAIGQSFGASLGSILGGAVGTSIAAGVSTAAFAAVTNAVLPGVGALIGAVLGTVLGDKIGELIAGDEDWARLDGRLEIGLNRFGLVNSSFDGLSPIGGQALMRAQAELLNSVISEVGGQVDSHETIEFSYRLSDRKAPELSFDDGDADGPTVAALSDPIQLTQVGAALSLYHLQFSDGDIAKIAALEAWKDSLREAAAETGQTALLEAHGGIQAMTAPAVFSRALAELSAHFAAVEDYKKFVQNATSISALMQAEPNTAFSVGWSYALIQFEKMGLFNGVDFTADDRDNVLQGTFNADKVAGLAGDDIIDGRGGDDVLEGGRGDDLLIGGEGNDTLIGGDGNDEFHDESGSSSVDGGDGFDLITFAKPFDDYNVIDHGNNQITVEDPAAQEIHHLSGVEFLMFSNTVKTYSPVYENVFVGTLEAELLRGTPFDDAINGLDGDDTIYALSGDDFVSGDGGDDLIFGGLGDDWLFGVLGQDRIFGDPGADHLFGGDSDDALHGGSEPDTLDGGSGDDVLDGGAGADNILGSGGGDVAEGGIGDDVIDGGSSDDNLFGGADDDLLYGGTEDDELTGGDGDDDLRSGAGDDVVYGGQGADRIEGGEEDDLLFGGTEDDRLFGGAGDDVAYGGDGNDLIFALDSALASDPFVHYPGVYDSSLSAANVYREYNADLAYGGDGNDQIALNWAASVAFGGSGADYFWFKGGNQQRINGGSGYDIAQAQITNFIDAVWYKSQSSGRIGAQVFYTDANAVPHSEAYSSLLVDVEEIRTHDGEALTFGRHFANGTGNGAHMNVSPTSLSVTLSDADFEAVFGDEVFLQRHLRRRDDPRSVQDEQSIWEDLTAGNDFYRWTDDLDTTSSGTQAVRGGAGHDDISGGSGDDTLDGEGGNDKLYGGAGTDNLTGGDGADRLYGESGEDTLSASFGNDSVFGGSGSDWIDGGGGDDSLYGDDGHDYMIGGYGSDAMFGGQGRDRLDGQADDDILYGEDAPDILVGGSGADQLFGGDAADHLAGGEHADSAYGGSGRDLIYGGSGDDVLGGGASRDELYGEDGYDTLQGDDDNDSLFGGAEDDVLYGGAGDDLVAGDSGTGWLYGGSGNDQLVGDAVSDTAYGGIGNDDIAGNDGADLLLGEDGDDVIRAGLGDDVAYGGNNDDFISGDAGDDTLDGAAGDDILVGGVGADKLMGQDAADVLMGEDGADRLFGGSGDDALLDGSGVDNLYGGSGSDQFILSADGDDDIIRDFEIGVDQINLHSWGDIGFEDLIIEEVVNGNNDVSWIRVSCGVEEILIRYGAGAILSASSLTAEEFRFFRYVTNDAGARTFEHSRHDGNLFVSLDVTDGPASEVDRIVFTDLRLENVIFSALQTNDAADPWLLRVSWRDEETSGEVRVSQNGEHIEEFEFADGMVLSAVDADFLRQSDPIGNSSRDEDKLFGTADDDRIIGTADSDRIYGGLGDDILSAGIAETTYWQYLYGGGGSDTYLYGKSDRRVSIVSAAEGDTSGDIDKVVLLDLALSEVTLSAVGTSGDATLVIGWNDGTDSGELRIAHNGSRIETFEFADGATVSAITADFLEQSDPVGNNGREEDKIVGTNGDDRILGTAQSDRIYGGNGDDWLSAGGGDAGRWQYLYGQAGDDTYVISQGDGLVFITSDTSGDADRLIFSDLDYSDVTFSTYNYGNTAHGEARIVSWNNGVAAGELRLSHLGQSIESFEFSDGTTLSYDQIPY